MSQPASFSEVIANDNWQAVSAAIRATTRDQVERALAARHRGQEEFQALISPAATPYLEAMAQESVRLTRRRFGNTVQMYVPLYLHNECQNVCTYCGFSVGNKLPRTVLTDEQVEAEAAVISAMGYRHVLLVTGETARLGVDYFAHQLDILRPHFDQLSLEVQPLDEDEYRRLADHHHLHAVMVYQETYHQQRYTQHHKAGRKRDFHYRLQTPDRLGRAGIHKIGLAALIGLDDWRTEAWFVKRHLDYCSRRYWRTRFSLSFPRLRPFSGGTPEVDMSDRDFVQLVCAHRLCDEDVELSLSTRERPVLRDHLFPLGFTAISAGSATEPGGYANPKAALEQFEISDTRSAQEVAAVIRRLGLEPVWKDWDLALNGVSTA